MIAHLESMLTAAGYRVHTYTSPHLVHFHERIKLSEPSGGRPTPITENVLVEALRACESANNGRAITFFEITTAAALYTFSQHEADVVLIEVGLGGLYDATNVIDRPMVTVITPVDLDHMDFLGDTIEKIAFEKAGIIKTNRPVVVGEQTSSALKVIQGVAREKNASVIAVGIDYTTEPTSEGFDFVSGETRYSLPLSALYGDHQTANAATAIATLEQTEGFDVDDQAMRDGLATVRWPGRLQRIQPEMLPFIDHMDAEVWLDGGHNPSAGRVLAAHLSTIQQHDPRPLYLIAAIQKTKDVVNFLGPLSDLSPTLIGTTITDQPAFASAESIREAAHSFDLRATTAADYQQALRRIAELEKEKPQTTPIRVLICGSLFLVGQILQDLNLTFTD